ncbi:MAG TPA: Fe-S-containing protein [Candidatus Acidoferrales bacterium]|jgi:high-affinity iron transporter|nr:Fe-S-containing protein [Candidatus Acidoferrales bacterium]
MLSALLLALREGVEAALVVGIVLVYLNRTGRRALARYVWGGVMLASAASVAAAVLLDRWQVSEDGFEGLLMLVASVLVISMIIWMNRVARHLKKEIEQRVEAYAQKSTRTAGWGIGLFVFLMVVREGAELVLVLRAVELSSAGVQVWIGTTIGIAIAIAVGFFFFQGTLRIPLHRFFKATSAILMVVAFQLALTGIHELSEAMWIPSSKTEMSTIGPIVRNEVFFFVLILGAAALVVLREWFSAKQPAADEAPNPAQRRMREYEFRRQRRWSFAAAILCVAVVISFAGEYVYGRVAAAPSPAKTLVAQDSLVRIPLSELTDSSLHFYTAEVNGTVIRFLVIHKQNGDYATALDACQICGTAGYRQEGQNVICRNCGASIYIPSIGQSGGCNPISVKSRVAGGEVIVDLSALGDAASKIHS